MGILNEALNESCKVYTEFGCRNQLILRDFDGDHALFKDEKEGIVILPITEIKALEFNNESENGECLRDEDT